MRKLAILFTSAVLAACASNPVSYLPSGTKPIVNMESMVADRIQIDATSDHLIVENISDDALNIVYKLFWYDIEGVTQHSNETWQNLWLESKQSSHILLEKPTEESANYRVYLRTAR